MKDNSRTGQHSRYGITRSRLRQIIPVTPMGKLGDLSKQNIERAFAVVADTRGDDFLEQLEQGLIEEVAEVLGHQLAFSVIKSEIEKMGPNVWMDCKDRVFRCVLDLRSRGWGLVGGQPCSEGDVEFYKEGMFGRQLEFIRSKGVRKDVGLLLFLMLICELRAEAFEMRPWRISTRKLADIVPGIGPGEHQKVARRLRYITCRDNGCRPVFMVVEKTVGRRATSYELNPLYGNLACMLIGHLETRCGGSLW